MKYYIPIHCSNIDNVISSERIAPADYYRLCGYGYSYFKALNEVPCQRSICLLNSMAKVEAGEEQTEEIVYIELDEREVRAYASYPFSDGICVMETIALYPWNCRFLFMSEEAQRQAVILCRTSLCNKMWYYYAFDLAEARDRRTVSVKTDAGREEAVRFTRETIARDSAQNRLKGFLYAFVMGRYASVSQPLANLLQTERRMYDIATTLAGLKGYEWGRYQAQLEEMEARFEQVDPNRTELQRRWKAMIESRIEGDANRQAFDAIVRELGGEAVMKQNLALQTGLVIRPRTTPASNRYAEWEYYKRELEEYTLKQVVVFRMKKGDTNTSEDFRLDGMRVQMGAKYGDYYGRIVSQMIEGAEWLSEENLRLHRLEAASELTRRIRDIKIEKGEEWEGSAERTFLNDLRQHIGQGVKFDLTSAPDVVLKSMAIFVLKGDDFEEMMRYMEYSAMADYRFVLGLWGAMKGFAELPKTAIQRMRLDPAGEARIYLATHQLLKTAPEGVQVTVHEYQFRPKEQPQATVKTVSHELLQAIADKTIGLTNAQKASILDIWDENGGKADESFFKKVGKMKGIGAVKLKKLRETLLQEKKPAVANEPDLFGGQYKKTESPMDKSAWQYIEPLLPADAMVRQRVKDDFEWYLRSRRRSDSNAQMIAGYQLHLRQKANPSNPRYQWTATYFGGIDIDSVIKKLEEIYL